MGIRTTGMGVALGAVLLAEAGCPELGVQGPDRANGASGRANFSFEPQGDGQPPIAAGAKIDVLVTACEPVVAAVADPLARVVEVASCPGCRASHAGLTCSQLVVSRVALSTVTPGRGALSVRGADGVEIDSTALEVAEADTITIGAESAGSPPPDVIRAVAGSSLTATVFLHAAGSPYSLAGCYPVKATVGGAAAIVLPPPTACQDLFVEGTAPGAGTLTLEAGHATRTLAFEFLPANAVSAIVMTPTTAKFIATFPPNLQSVQYQLQTSSGPVYGNGCTCSVADPQIVGITHLGPPELLFPAWGRIYVSVLRPGHTTMSCAILGGPPASVSIDVVPR